jgi:hypothetical protein
MKGDMYMHSISVAGCYKDEMFSIYITVMDSNEYPPPVNRYHVMEVSVKSNSVKDVNNLNTDKDNSIKLEDFEFYLMCNGRIHNRISILDTLELLDYIHNSGTCSLFFGVPSIGCCVRQTILVLFEKIPEIHYMDSQVIIYYKPLNKLFTLSLKY